MRWASALSTHAETNAALGEATAALRRDLDGARADLLMTFVSAHHAPRYDLVLSTLRESFPESRVAGCSAAGVIGAGHEVETRPAVSLTAAWLPGVQLAVAHGDDALDFGTLPDEPHFLVLADGFTCDAEGLVGSLDEAFPTAAKVGGLASGGRFPGDNALFCDQKVHRGGAVVVALGGNVTVETIVAQGCRPIGRPMVVTRADENLIRELDKRKPSD